MVIQGCELVDAWCGSVCAVDNGWKVLWDYTRQRCCDYTGTCDYVTVKVCGC